MMKLRLLVGTVALWAVAGTTARAAEVTVKTLNSGPDAMMVFAPAFVKLAPGDSITFVPTDEGHNAEPIAGMAPEDAVTFKTVVGKEG